MGNSNAPLIEAYLSLMAVAVVGIGMIGTLFHPSIRYGRAIKIALMLVFAFFLLVFSIGLLLTLG